MVIMTKRHLITSALPYINGIKHLGNLIGSLLPADVYARFLRLQGHDVLFICGTDEHGTPAELAAHQAGISVEAYCEQLYSIQRDIYQQWCLSFDYFGRSSAPSNHVLTATMFQALQHNGFIQKRTIQQYYSLEDKRFLPDRYVEGTCPYCQYPRARGDQCDGCCALMDPERLQNPYSTISGSTHLEWRDTTHYFLDLPAIKPDAWLVQQPWSSMVKGIVRKWLTEGLQPRCITRDIQWGISVPHHDDKVFYVWFDAPNAYISITQDWAASSGNTWQDWWLSPDVHYTQFMAKDNVPFHAILWPSAVLGAKWPYHTVDTIKAFHWLTYQHGKFSTSQNRGIFLDKALTLYPVDGWRYYLLANCPETSDADFSEQHFASVVNKDLVGLLGNYVSRVLSMYQQYANSTVLCMITDNDRDNALYTNVCTHLTTLHHRLNTLQYRQAMASLRQLWVLGNEYLSQQAPWKHTETRLITLTYALYLMRLYGLVLYPILPNTADAILKACGESSCNATWPMQWELNVYPVGHTLLSPFHLFQRLDGLTYHDSKCDS
jgi:methionyl-tRNA synthetase